MDNERKYAYRYLLYSAALRTRQQSWMTTRWRDRLNPASWFRALRFARAAGVLADWLHNLAFFSAHDFQGFNEERFWDEYDWYLSTYPSANLADFRFEFERLIPNDQQVPDELSN